MRILASDDRYSQQVIKLKEESHSEHAMAFLFVQIVLNSLNLEHHLQYIVPRDKVVFKCSTNMKNN
ncbi:hypothetical protein VCR31J2_1300071 [Vibrio coralliirubri]|uniref:Uncharacterized protein n=1 Tax=Vibrio coralliirubri TaxID=1516159 RepID=A0AA87C033_9VIBR|nr:hypothetical protein VCR31J2_1300071 [Vibrio coralliirubri]